MYKIKVWDGDSMIFEGYRKKYQKKDKTLRHGR